MPTHLDPFTGEPLDDAKQLGRKPVYAPNREEPEDNPDMQIEGADQPFGFVRTHDRQRGARFRWSMALPAIIVSLLATVMVGAFAMLLGVRGSLTEHGDVLVPALIVSGAIAAVGGTFGSYFLWPSWARQGPLRTIAYGLAVSAVLLGVCILLLGFLFAPVTH